MNPADDVIWLICRQGGYGVRLAWKLPGQPAFEAPYDIATADTIYFDHPLIAIGPPRGGGSPPRFYALYIFPAVAPFFVLESAYSDDPMNRQPWNRHRALPNSGWTDPDYRNRGAMPVVLDTGLVVVTACGHTFLSP